jgi:hypothetical protein
VGALAIEFLNEGIEFGLLLQAVHARGTGCFFLEDEVHAFVSAVLLRSAWLDAFDGDSEPQPPVGTLALLPDSLMRSRSSHRANPMPYLPIPKTNDETYAKNTKEQYEALSHFVEAFELMVNEVREICIERVCSGTGSSERMQLVEISFHHQSMTAKPLFDIMRAIIAEIVNAETSPYYVERTMFKDMLSHIEKEYSALYWKRNDLLHGTWLIGYVGYDDPDASWFDVRKYRTTADGLKRATELPKSAAELSTLTTRCDDTRTWLGHVDFCLQDKTSITEYFKREGKEWKFFPTLGSVGTTLPRK